MDNILDLGLLDSITSLNILQSMFYQGSITFGGSNIIMARIVSTNKDYIIKMERHPVQKSIWSTPTSYNYLCIISFEDIFGRELLKITMTEVDILIMLDNISEYLSEGQLFNTWLGNIKTTELYKSETIYLNKLYNDHYMSDTSHIMTIRETDNRYNTYIDRLTIYFNDDSLELFAGTAFFTFLIDTDLMDDPANYNKDWSFL